MGHAPFGRDIIAQSSPLCWMDALRLPYARQTYWLHRLGGYRPEGTANCATLSVIFFLRHFFSARSEIMRLYCLEPITTTPKLGGTRRRWRRRRPGWWWRGRRWSRRRWRSGWWWTWRRWWQRAQPDTLVLHGDRPPFSLSVAATSSMRLAQAAILVRFVDLST
jgi:hypothetical protein